MTVGIYIRVSTEEQAKEGYSIPAQKEKLTFHCLSQGWEDYKYYIDEGISAKNMDRPQLQMLLKDVRSGKIDVVLVFRLDRLTRRVKDLYTLLEELDKYKCVFKSATEPYDTSSAMGRMFIGLVALLAQWEVENLSERVKMALREKVSGGERVGGIPFGFDLNENEKLVPNDKAKVVLDIIKKFKSGMAPHAIARRLTHTNTDKEMWHAQAIFRILRNPALYGSTRWNDEVYEDTHKGIISKDEFMKIQQMLNDQAMHHRRDVESIYLFQGILICPTCGNPLSVNRFIRKRKDGTEYQGTLYKCQNCYKEGKKMLSIGEQRFEEALCKYMRDFELPMTEPVQEPDDEKDILLKQLRQIENQRKRYQKAWAAERMTDEEFDELMDETRPIMEDLKAKINQIPESVKLDEKALKEFVLMFNENFQHLEQEEKKIFMSQFIRRIEFQLVPQPPKNKRNKHGKELVVVTNIESY